nr:MAG TPA: hypothetical protein [Caudoviricetes sp.]
MYLVEMMMVLLTILVLEHLIRDRVLFFSLQEI